MVAHWHEMADSITAKAPKLLTMLFMIFSYCDLDYWFNMQQRGMEHLSVRPAFLLSRMGSDMNCLKVL